MYKYLYNVDEHPRRCVTVNCLSPPHVIPASGIYPFLFRFLVVKGFSSKCQT